jgi:RNA polymerase sigma factor (sigma-70 family)
MAISADNPLPFDVVYGEHRIRLVRLAALMVGSTEVAEDIVHDAFVRCYLRWPELVDPVAYLRRAVVNGCRGELRKLRIRRKATPPTETAIDAVHHELWDVLGAVPARQRAAIVLHYYEGLGERDLALALGCSDASARSLLHRGLTNLRRQLGHTRA